ncbi:Sec-independent protein translocase protein TatB [Jannaschia ovalis]|uniref:Sec-independent protein translocase protein TatB n=1 Tax=Jannaschia ovalis TaxID=3038773 RepID=A0ABY8LAJ5_9RHOB|nr:Sec-independent protein translocase protein TatB [Jannaschia sp. GRR-S6-38]WGH78319.1 Sec-independent protein translocase protein TatB [Jannaschia sp. GRR-S6-38]
MLDIGWSELLVIGVVALIVVGPKDLPRMFRTLGEFTGKARRMARDFQTAMNDAADESGVGDIAGDLKKIANPKKFGMDKVREATKGLKPWEPDETTGPATRDLAEKRAEAKKKIAENAARMAEERRAREAVEAAELSEEPGLRPDPEAPEPAAAKPAPPRKTAARKPAAKKAAAKPAAKKKAPAKKAAPKKDAEA